METSRTWHSPGPPSAFLSPVSSRGPSRDRGNKIPRGALSPEAEELRKLLRQDIEECLRGIMGEGMQDLRRDLCEWLSHELKPKEETRSFSAAPFDVDGHGVSSMAVRADSAPLERLDSRIDQLLPSGRSVAPCTAADLQGEEMAEDAAQAPRPDEATMALEAAQPSNFVATGPWDSQDDKDWQSQAVGDSQHDKDWESQSVWWEWEHSNPSEGWGRYRARQSETIEKAWQSGVSRFRVRSGRDGRTPMEIYFMDMVQLDPESGRVRRIRRVGKVPWYTRPRRLWRSLSYSFETREPLWETLEQYRSRQSCLSTTDMAFVQRTRVKPSDASLVLSPVRRNLRRLVKSTSLISFINLSSLVTLCWCVWFGIDVQRYPDGVSMYEKEILFVAVEIFFNLFFLVELVIRIGACVSVWECLKDVWIRIDALCVLGSIGDCVLVPALIAVRPSFGNQVANTDWAVFRSLRLFKLLRVARLSRASLEMDIFVKGIWSGLKESSVVWAILFFLVFIFSILLTSYGTDEMRETTFSSLGLSMNLLFSSGILLDGVADVLDGMVRSNDVAGYVLFLFFVIISQYIILNMLIGIMTSVAGDVRGEEKARSNLYYLRHKLRNILECYIHDDGKISRKEFGLIIANADVHTILRHFGADLEHLASMEQSLYANTDFIHFDTLFETISQLNEAKTSTVWDIFHVQVALQRKLNSIESQLALAGFHGAP